jgi:ABC-type multidrug transport system permease subunit
MLVAMLLGFVTTFLLHLNAPQLGRRDWLAGILALAAVGGLALTVVADPLTGALRGSFPELWAALAAWIATAALFARAMLALFRRWAAVPTIVLFVVLGVPSSGAAVAPALLPAFYAAIGRWLPNGATVQTIRDIVYFHQNQHIEPILVEAAWLAASFAALMLAARLRDRRSSPGRPAGGPARTAPVTDSLHRPAAIRAHHR